MEDLIIQDGKNFEASDVAKRRILKLYRDDVSKFAKGYENKVFALLDVIPAQLSKKKKRNINYHQLVKTLGIEVMNILLFGYMKL